MSDTKLEKRTILINFWRSDSGAQAYRGDDGTEYSGRLLGLINDREFASLIKSTDVLKKCYTSATMPLSEIVDNHEELDGYRLAVAVKKIDDKIIVGQKLFISERLSLISYLNADKSAGITGENGAYILIEEEQLGNEA